MSEQSQATNESSYFDLHVEGVGYLNRVRTVKPKTGGQGYLACSVSAMRGSTDDVAYTKFECRVSGMDAQKIVRQLEADVNAEKRVIIGFRISDIYPETFTYEKGERQGQTGVSLKGRLLRVKFAKVNGESIPLSQSAVKDGEHAPACSTKTEVRVVTPGESLSPKGKGLPGRSRGDRDERGAA